MKGEDNADHDSDGRVMKLARKQMNRRVMHVMWRSGLLYVT